MDARATIAAIVAAELDQEIIPSASFAAQDLAELYGDTTAAVVFYGSCLQQKSDEDKVLDFYVLVDDCKEANGGWFLGWMNEVLPPNVFYREVDMEGRTIRSKYALMSVKGFDAAMQPSRFNPTFWARFAQPCAIAWSRDDVARSAVLNSVSQAIETMVQTIRPLFDTEPTSAQLWSTGFQRTYKAELRAEDAEARGRQIYEQNASRYDRLRQPALDLAGEGRSVMSARIAWFFRAVQGKTLSFLRLIKGAFTFAGAIDYLAWKIGRHSGVEMEIKPWQRRHALIGGLSLFIQTRMKGGFR